MYERAVPARIRGGFVEVATPKPVQSGWPVVLEEAVISMRPYQTARDDNANENPPEQMRRSLQGVRLIRREIARRRLDQTRRHDVISREKARLQVETRSIRDSFTISGDLRDDGSILIEFTLSREGRVKRGK